MCYLVKFILIEVILFKSICQKFEAIFLTSWKNDIEKIDYEYFENSIYSI